MRFLDEIRSMAQRAVEVVLEVPLFQTFFMENMQTFEFSNLLSSKDGL